MGVSSVIKVVAERRAVIFDLFHTLTALESTWSEDRRLTHEMLSVSKHAWDEQLHERSTERLTGAKAVGLTTIMVTRIIREVWPERIPERQRHADFVVESLTGLLTA